MRIFQVVDLQWGNINTDSHFIFHKFHYIEKAQEVHTWKKKFRFPSTVYTADADDQGT